MPIDALSVLCAQLTRDLLAIAKFLLYIDIDMNLSYVYLESRIFMSSFVFCLALCVVFMLSLYVCYSCYYNKLCG